MYWEDTNWTENVLRGYELNRKCIERIRTELKMYWEDTNWTEPAQVGIVSGLCKNGDKYRRLISQTLYVLLTL